MGVAIALQRPMKMTFKAFNVTDPRGFGITFFRQNMIQQRWEYHGRTKYNTRVNIVNATAVCPATTLRPKHTSWSFIVDVDAAM